MEGKDFLQAAVKENQTNCPVSYSLVKYLSCLNSITMALETESCVSNFKKMLHLLVNNGQVRELDCDKLINKPVFILSG